MANNKMDDDEASNYSGMQDAGAYINSKNNSKVAYGRNFGIGNNEKQYHKGYKAALSSEGFKPSIADKHRALFRGNYTKDDDDED